jgi:hypothetical protein
MKRSRASEEEEEEPSDSEEEDYDAEEGEEGEEEEEEEYEPEPQEDDLVVQADDPDIPGKFVRSVGLYSWNLVATSPWYERAFLMLCIFRLRPGPWVGKLNRDIQRKIARLVYEQVPPLDAVYYCATDELYPYDAERARWDDQYSFISACIVCARPHDDTVGCWVHDPAPEVWTKGYVCQPTPYSMEEDSSLSQSIPPSSPRDHSSSSSVAADDDAPFVASSSSSDHEERDEEEDCDEFDRGF